MGGFSGVLFRLPTPPKWLLKSVVFDCLKLSPRYCQTIAGLSPSIVSCTGLEVNVRGAAQN
jgi:hypothetical protein